MRSATWLELDSSGEIDKRSRVVTFVEMSVNRAFRRYNAVIVGHDLIKMLPLGKAVGNDAVLRVERFLVKRNAFSGLRKERSVFTMSPSGIIKESNISAGRKRSFRTAVTDEGSF